MKLALKMWINLKTNFFEIQRTLILMKIFIDIIFLPIFANLSMQLKIFCAWSRFLTIHCTFSNKNWITTPKRQGSQKVLNAKIDGLPQGMLKFGNKKLISKIKGKKDNGSLEENITKNFKSMRYQNKRGVRWAEPSHPPPHVCNFLEF